jgi:hypothetical protein
MLAAKAAIANAAPCSQLVSRLQRNNRPKLGLRLAEFVSDYTDLPIIELHGRSGSGKTHLLYMLAIEAILAGKGVVVFDAEGTWDLLRFVHLLQQHVDAFEARSLLDNLLIYQPVSLAEMLTDAKDLTRTLTVHMREMTIQSILVDSISSFYWQAKSQLPSVIEALRDAASMLHAALIMTNWHIGWRHLTIPQSVRLHIERKEVLQFTQGVEQALITAEARAEVLNRGLFYIKDNRGNRQTFCIKQNIAAMV